MAAKTYKKFAEEIRTAFYAGIASDEASFSLKFFAELIGQEVAEYARINAFENSNQGELTFVNDSFITTYKNLPVLYDTQGKYYYTTLPDIPPALPRNQEITRISPVGSNRREIFPMSQKDKGVQDLLPQLPNAMLYYTEGGTIIYDNITYTPPVSVDLRMIGTVPSGNLLDATLNLSKNYQFAIMTKILGTLDPMRFRKDIINNAVDAPTPVQ